MPLGCRPKLIEYSGSCEDLVAALKPTLKERLQQAENNCRVLRSKIDEVNDIFRNNPDLAQMYVQRRTEHRRAKGHNAKGEAAAQIIFTYLIALGEISGQISMSNSLKSASIWRTNISLMAYQ